MVHSVRVVRVMTRHMHVVARAMARHGRTMIGHTWVA